MEIETKIIAFSRLWAFHFCSDTVKIERTDEDEGEPDVHELGATTQIKPRTGFQMKEDDDEYEDRLQRNKRPDANASLHAGNRQGSRLRF